MSHVVIINQKGTGPGGAAEGRIEWTPSHELSGNEQMRRVEKATRLLGKANDALYGSDSGDGPDSGP